MYRIALLNMPLVDLAMPPLALVQLQAAVRRELGDRVVVEVHHLNHDFAHHVGMSAYEELLSFDHHPTGLGEWLFRPAAFPGLSDNTDAYFARYYPQPTPRNQALYDTVLRVRAGLDQHLDALIDRYALDRADVVGLTSMFSQNVASLAMARRIKARAPGVVTVLGGANCEGVMGRELIGHADMLDFVFSGPSLRSFPTLLRCLMEGDEPGCHRIDGVFSRRNRMAEGGCGTVAGAPEAVPAVRAFGEENDINELTEFDYAPFLDRYEASFPGGAKPHLLFETSRGCWWGERAHCTFCGLNGSTIAYRSMRPETAFRLMDGLFQHAHRAGELQSADNILPKDFLAEVLPFLDTPPEVSLFYEVKADLDEDDFRVLARARVLRIQPGIEALNTSTLKLMRKGTSVFQNLQFLINSVRYGITPSWNLLVGFPGEEIDVYQKYLRDIPRLLHLSPPGGVFPVRFDRFSPYYDERERYGLDLRPVDWYALTYPFPPQALDNLAYYFANHDYAAPYAFNVARMLGKLRAAVDQWVARWEGGRPPELRLDRRDDGAYVFDSRGGTPVEYPLEPGDVRVLDALSGARKPAALAGELAGIDVGVRLAALEERGLVFHEGERWMSLVVPPPTPFAIPLPRMESAAAAA